MKIAKRLGMIICIISLILSTLMSLCSCNIGDFFVGSDNNNSDDSNVEASSPGISYQDANITQADTITPYIITKNPSPAIASSFCDGYCNYFYYKLGEVENVPTYYSNLWYFNGIGEQTLKIENSSTVTKTIETSIGTFLSNTVDNTYAASINIAPTVTLADSIEFGVISKGLEYSKTTSDTIASSLEYSNSITTTISNSYARSLKLKSGDPKGSYRFIVYSDVDVYAVIKYDIDRETTTYDYLVTVKDEKQTEGWFFGDRNSLSIDSQDNFQATFEDKLKLDESFIGNTDFSKTPDTYHLRRRLIHNWDDQEVKWENGRIIAPSVWELMDWDTISALNITRARIKVEYTTTTPAGECEATMIAYMSYETRNGSTKLGEKTTVAGKSQKSQSASFDVEITRFMTSDGHMGVEFHSGPNGLFDLSKNDCNFIDIKFTIELY